MKQFSQQSRTYEQVAAPQKELASCIIKALKPHAASPGHILELGCGTGILSEKLATLHPQHLTLVDESQAMLEIIAAKHQQKPLAPQVTFQQSDVEQWIPRQHSFDIITSSALVQWLDHLPQKLKHWHASLTAQGLLVLGTFGPQTLQEVYQGFAHVTGETLTVGTHFHSIMQWQKWLSPDHWHIHSLSQKSCIWHHESPQKLLRSLRLMGVTRPSSLLSPSHTKQLLTYLQKQQTPQGIPCTWELIWIVAQKKQPPQT